MSSEEEHNATENGGNSSLSEGVESSISQVGEDSAKKAIPVWFWGVLVLMMILIVASAGSGEEDTSVTDGVKFTEEEYKVKGAPAPVMPRSKSPPVSAQPQQPEPLKTIDLTQELTPEERQVQRKAVELAEQRRRAPLVLVNKREEPSTQGTTGGVSSLRQEARERMLALEKSTQKALTNLSDEGSSEAGLGSISTTEVEAVTAGYVSDLSYKVLQGKTIPAVLETAVNSDLPGMMRASVSEPVYSEDGNALLIPQGSRLIGEYKSGIKRGQVRVFVIWSRLIRPDGIDIKLDSPGSDSLGRSGLTGFVDTHFMERFGSSALLSLIGGYAQDESDNDNQQAVLSDSFSKSAEIALENSINISPTIHINQGERINVFVAKDLNFKQAVLYAQRMNKF